MKTMRIKEKNQSREGKRVTSSKRQQKIKSKKEAKQEAVQHNLENYCNYYNISGHIKEIVFETSPKVVGEEEEAKE